MDADYRVRVRRPTYRGSDRRKQDAMLEEAHTCGLIETYLQQQFDALPVGGTRVILYPEVADKIRRDPETVRRLMRSIQGGTNGVTFAKQDSRIAGF